jgi:lipopolysaccharide transport system ATP-binding protein
VSLLPGTYNASIYCTAGGVLCDWITDAATVEVEPGDFYGTGKLPPNGYGSVILPHRWTQSV